MAQRLILTLLGIGVFLIGLIALPPPLAAQISGKAAPKVSLRCQPPITGETQAVFGWSRLAPGWSRQCAEHLALRAWKTGVEKRHGAKFINPKNAEQVKMSCRNNARRKPPGWYCAFTARPCARKKTFPPKSGYNFRMSPGGDPCAPPLDRR